MSTLEDAAGAAVAHVQPLRERLTELEHECEEATKYVNAMRDRLEADRTALREAVSELAHGAEDAGKQIADALPALESALGALLAVSQDNVARAAQAVQTEAAALDGVGLALDAVDIDTAPMADAVAASAAATLQRASEVEQALAQAIDAAEQLLSVELAGMLAEAHRELEQQTAALVTLFHDTCAATLAQSDQDWAAKVAEVQGVADKAFAGMEQHAKDVTDYTEELMRQLADEQRDAIDQEMETLRSSLDSAGHELAEDKGRLQTAAEMLFDSLRGAADGARTAEAKLDEVRGRWGIEGFPC